MKPIKIIIQIQDEHGILKYRNFYTDEDDLIGYWVDDLEQIGDNEPCEHISIYTKSGHNFMCKPTQKLKNALLKLVP